jgi:hypothetical protein
MALTLPDDFEAIPPPEVKRLFLILLNRLMASRCPVLRKLGGFWKQEFQKRGALHFHLLLYGIDLDASRYVQGWIARQWNGLIGDHYPEEEREKHLWWHLRDGWEKRRGVRLAAYTEKEDNFQEVSDFAGYFAKYFGKDEEAGVLPEPVPGKWWGCFNRKNIPWAERKEIALPLRVRIHVQRAARKMRQKRAEAARHAVVMAKLKKAHGLPYVSPTELEYGRHHRRGTRLGELYRHLARGEGFRIGKPKFPNCVRYSSVILTGKHVPNMIKELLKYGGKRALEDRESRPF